MKKNLVSTTLETLTVPGMTPGDAARELSAGLQSDVGFWGPAGASFDPYWYEC